MSFIVNSVARIFARNHLKKSASFVHSVIFGQKNLLLTNCLISAGMGAVGDAIQQNYDIMMSSIKKKGVIDRKSSDQSVKSSTILDAKQETDSLQQKFSFVRTLHMTTAGLTTGTVTHYWYIVLDRVFGTSNQAKNRRLPVLMKLVLLDQILFSPINLFVYFVTLGLCERSSWSYVKRELMEKGFENIYVAEWLIWPPAQMINFALLPLRYRILFDNVISLGFDIYSPYVKYKTTLRVSEQTTTNTNNSHIA